MIELLTDILREGGFSVESVNDIDGLHRALLSGSRPTVICDEFSGQFDGLRLWTELRERVGGAAAGFLMLTDAGSGQRVGECLDAGMHEVILKPFDLDELHARIRRVFHMLALQQRPAQAQEPSQPAGFAGDLEYLGLPDLLMNLHQNSRTGELSVTVRDGEYVFSFKRGALSRVDGPRGLKHRKALFRALRESYGRFAFVPKEQVRTSHHTYENIANLVLQAVQEADEYPLYRDRLPADPVPVTLSAKIENTKVGENSAIQPFLEGLIRATTIDILIHACPETDLTAARELRELMENDVLVLADSSEAEVAS